jgi:hypothetical protein
MVDILLYLQYSVFVSFFILPISAQEHVASMLCVVKSDILASGMIYRFARGVQLTSWAPPSAWEESM